MGSLKGLGFGDLRGSFKGSIGFRVQGVGFEFECTV